MELDNYITKGILIKLYCKQKLTMEQIAKKLKVCTATIYNYLKWYNLCTRTYGSWKPWNNGLTIQTSKKLSNIGSKISKANKGKSPWNKGLTAETDVRVARFEKHRRKVRKYATGKDHHSFGKPKSDETKRKLSLSHGGTGIPYESHDYDNQFFVLRPKILERDGYTCQCCGMTEEEHLIVYGTVLNVHHIDYDKKNSDEKNLISTCFGCNIRANFNKPYWIEFYTNRITQPRM